MSLKKLEVGPDHHLSIDNVFDVAKDPSIRVFVSKKAQIEVKKARDFIEGALKDRKVIYGVTTGFGSFKDRVISQDDVVELQENLIRSHCVGVGPLLNQEQVRASLLVRLNSLAKGFSGVRQELLDLVCILLNKNIIPVVPSQGSVGASGDLAPLSHMGLILMGEGEVFFKGKRQPTKKVFKQQKIQPIHFQAKEGLAFNNGTSVMAGCAALSLYRGMHLADIADLSSAMTLEAICGTSNAFDSRIHMIRPHSGQILSAKMVKKYVSDSSLVDSVENRVQDSYSIRCVPQVHGAVRDALTYVRLIIEREINSVTDNPLIFSKDKTVLSGGNFHGEPIAIAMDTFAIAISELANISERRIAKLLDPSTNQGLPAFLINATKAGLHSGLMILQYTAAALVSENKIFSHPASVDSIPTSANQEDHVSMGSIAVQKSFRVIENAEKVISIEMLCSVQGIDFRGSERLGKYTKKAYKLIRSSVKHVSGDRVFSIDIEKTYNLFDPLYKILRS